jgi:hypothetical protein
MKHSLASRFLAFMLGMTSVSAIAQEGGASPASAKLPAPGPTTKILAIGTIVPGTDPAALQEILPSEVRETVLLYLDGKIDQWYSQQTKRGVVFVLNMTDVAAAHEMLEKLPLGVHHMMTFELLPLAPLNPLRRLEGIASEP